MNRPITSASNLFRRRACPGSENAEKAFAQQESEYSKEGTLLHSLFFNPDRLIASATPAQLELVADAERYARREIEAFRNANGIGEDDPCVVFREIELPLVDSDGTELPPGHADFITLWPEHRAAFVVDAKFGYAEVEEAPDNLQLADYAAGFFQSRDGVLERIGVCIVQPRNFGPRTTTAVYDPAAIDLAISEIRRIADEAKKEGAPTVAGDHCTYCRAKTACNSYLMQMSELAILPMNLAVETLTNDRLVSLHLAGKAWNGIKDDVSAEMKRRVESGSVKGWKLRSMGDVRKMFDATQAYLSLNKWLKEEGHAALTAAAFDSCREMSWGKIEELFYKLTGMTQKKSKEVLKAVLAPYVIAEPKAPAVMEDK